MPLRVLHCVRSLSAADGGTARSVPALAAAEAANGADVVVWSQQSATIDLKGFEAARFVSGDISHAACAEWTPDIIHDHGLWLPSNHAVARLGRQQRIPRVVSPRGMLEPWCLNHRRIRKQVAWQLYQQRDLASSCCLHATSRAESLQFRRLGFRQPVICLPNGVTLTEAAHVDIEARPATLRREVLFLSRLHPVKGLENLIDAWHGTNTSGWKLRIVGPAEGGYRGQLQKRIDSHHLQDSVSISDAVHSEDKWRLIRDADLMVLPSFSENFGIVIAEALGVGTPVITTTGTPWSEIQERRCGWYVEPTVAAIAAGLRSALSTAPAELQAMGDRGRHWVTAEFAWRDVGRRMLQSYEWVLGRGAVAGRIDPPHIQTLRPAA